MYVSVPLWNVSDIRLKLAVKEGREISRSRVEIEAKMWNARYEIRVSDGVYTRRLAGGVG
jgi:hypothetical protein